jgi:competence protein ComEC
VIGINSIPRGGLELVQETFPHLTLENAVTGMTQSYRGEFGEVTWSVLQISDGSVMEDDGTSINNQSVVVLISTPHFSVLLTGDIEISAQTTLMKAIAPLHVNVVKVPHHGSRSQVPTFAQWTGGSLAWISVGADNDYGHPSREAITYYKQAGMVILTTADCGDIAVLKQEMLGFAPRDECRSV